jgi:DNA-binding NarL/FixJ family response regulator
MHLTPRVLIYREAVDKDRRKRSFIQLDVERAERIIACYKRLPGLLKRLMQLEKANSRTKIFSSREVGVQLLKHLGFRRKEIAEVLKVKDSTVKTMLRRSSLKLQKVKFASRK